MSISNTLATAALASVKSELDGGRLYLFAGTVPADADDALDMGTTHTQIVEFTVDGDGTTGLTFASPSGTGMSKTLAEVWQGLVDFDGFASAPGPLTPTFWRFGAPGDDCRGAASGPRLQGTAGAPYSDLPVSPQTDNGTNTLTVDTFAVVIEAA